MIRTRLLAAVICLAAASAAAAADAKKPNVVIVVADDLGWRDCGYHGNPIIKTPNLDDMAAKGLRFDYFYPGQQMCSPGRFAILTGRTPFRAGIHHLQNTRPQEVMTPRSLKQAGYKSAHFGKWHLGSGDRSPVGMGFDQAAWTPNFFDLGAKFRVNDTNEMIETTGDSSLAVMGLALDYIRKQATGKEPFFVQVCFGSPHAPHRAAAEFRALYKDQDKKADFLGEVSGLDAAVGKLREELKKLGVADNTLLWFTSDNGGITPDSKDPAGMGKMTIGCRTQSLIEWPARIKQPVTTTVPCCHTDMYPTLLDITGVKVENQPVLDGISLVPLIDGKMTERPKPLGFMLWAGNNEKEFVALDFTKGTQGVWIDGRYKLSVSADGKADKKDGAVALYDIFADPAQKTNLGPKHPEIVLKMRAAMDEWRRSVRDSYDGKDFPKK